MPLIKIETLLAISLGTVALIATVFTYNDRKKKTKIRQLKMELNRELIEETRDLNEDAVHQPVYSEEIIREQLSRNYAFLGEQGENKLRNSFVIVVGVGGVGSHAAHMLLRAGVQKIRIIDFDQVTLSSLNRHAVASYEDVGTPKTACLQKYFKKICPHANVESVVDLFSGEKAGKLLEGEPDYVLDCIDHIPTKIELIEYCVKSNLRVISSMGAGAKSDPSRICIADISDTQEDPLARATRRGLRKLGIASGVDVVYSVEKPGKVNLVPLEDSKVENAHEYATLPSFRTRILPVLGTIPALFGNAMATHVITKLADFPTDPLSNKLRDGTYIRLHRDLTNYEHKQHKTDGPIPLTIQDVGYVFEEVWKGRCALTKNLDRLCLVRWNPNQPLSLQNVICLSKNDANKHIQFKDLSEIEAHYSQEFSNFVHDRFEQDQIWSLSR